MPALAQETRSSAVRVQTFAVMVFLVLICLPIRFWIGPVLMTSDRLFLALAALPLTVAWLRDPALRRDGAAWCLVLFVGWGTIAMAQTSPEHLIENTGTISLEMLFVYILGRVCIRTEDAFARMIVLCGAILALLLPMTLWELHSGTPLIVQVIDALPTINSVETVTIAPRLGLERTQVVFAHPIHFGFFATTCFTLIVMGLGDGLGVVARIYLVLVVLLSVFCSLSSGPILALVVQCFLLIWFWAFGAKRAAWLWLGGILAALYIGVDLASNRTPLRVFMSYATFSSHNAFWRGLILEWGMVNVWANPVFGLGFNDWERPSFMVSGSVDNYWLSTAMTYGLPGFAACVAAFTIAIFRTIRSDKKKLSPMRLSWIITMVGVILMLCTVHVWSALQAYVFLLLGAGQFRSGTVTERPLKASPPPPVFARSIAAPSYVRDEAIA